MCTSRAPGHLISILLAVVAFVSLPFASTTSAQNRGAADPRQWVAIAPIRDEADMQRLVRVVDLRGRYQDVAIALCERREIERLKRTFTKSVELGSPVAGETLYAVTLLPGETFAPPPRVRLLLQSPTQAIVGVPAGATVDPEVWIKNRKRAPFHDGFVRVPGHRMSPARGSPGRSSGRSSMAPPNADPRVAAIVSAVDPNNLDADVNYYSTTYFTRRSDRPDGVAAQNDLLARFQALGLSAGLFDFDVNADDVIAEIPGLLDPDKVVIVGAHYDSINGSGALRVAPGADDNGSGTAAVLELARIFSTSGQPFRYTVRFCLFASEEFGLVGSDAYAASLANAGVEVVAMLNTDMNAYRNPTDSLDLDFATNDTTAALTNDLVAISQLYVPTLPVVTGTLSGGTSDHRSFYYEGYPAAFYFEDLDHYSPYIHTKDDTYGLSANDFTLAGLIVQSVAAGLATYAEPVDLVIDHTPLADTEDSWNPARVTAKVTPATSVTVAACELHYDVGAGDVTVAMAPSGAPDEWIAEIPGTPVGTTVRYSLLATDSNANTQRLPAADDFTFHVGVHDRFFFDDFESGAGSWSHAGLQDDFELGSPAGKSSDPPAAWSGANCFGNDLGISGDGAYPSNANMHLDSPSQSGIGRHHVHLSYRRWLGVEDATYDQAQILVGGTVVWTNPTGSGTDNTVDHAWTLHDLDVSSIADGRPTFLVKWRMISDGGLEFGGWNVDDVELYGLEPGVEPELWRDAGVLSLTNGGTTHLQVNLGASEANRGYVVVGGVSGTAPGFHWGSTQVPINFDGVTLLLIRSLPSLPGFLGTTDGNGRASATFTVPAGQDPALAGTVLHFAAVTLGPVDHATNPVDVVFSQ